MHPEEHSEGSWRRRRINVAACARPGKCKVLPAQEIGAPQADIPSIVPGTPSERTAQKWNGGLVEAIVKRLRISRRIAGANIEIEEAGGCGVRIVHGNIG